MTYRTFSTTSGWLGVPVVPCWVSGEWSEDLKAKGVIRAIPFLGFHVEPVVWLVTRSDTERDLVTEHGIPRDLVIQRLQEAGVRPDLAARAGVTVESEETIEREHGGNWRIAMQ